jgi:NDP-sugar pyrophosphorylase family protein
MQAFLLAAGLGSRLKPLTDTMPKALVPIAGRPLLDHTIEKLETSGVNKIVINIHHFAEQIKEYINTHKYDSEILFSDESLQLLETGGGLKFAEQLFDKDEPILIHNVDIISNANLKKLYELGKENAAVLLVSERKTQRYLLFDNDNTLVGWTNIATGEVKSPYKNLNVENCKRYAFSGIHTFSPTLFQLMKNFPDKFSIIDFYLDVCDKIKIHAFHQTNLNLIDVGKCDTLAKAETIFKNNNQSLHTQS